MLISKLLFYLLHPRAAIIMLYSIYMSHKFKSRKLWFASKVGGICGIDRITIGKNCAFGKNAILTAYKEYHGYKYDPYIKIGQGCNFGDWIHITSINNIIIGNGVLTGRFVIITDNAHGTTSGADLDVRPEDRQLTSKGPIYIGNNVWIGDKVTILAGVTIGNGSIIGANSVVTKNIPPYGVAAGNPAKVIKVMRKS